MEEATEWRLRLVLKLSSTVFAVGAFLAIAVPLLFRYSEGSHAYKACGHVVPLSLVVTLGVGGLVGLYLAPVAFLVAVGATIALWWGKRAQRAPRSRDQGGGHSERAP